MAKSRRDNERGGGGAPPLAGAEEGVLERFDALGRWVGRWAIISNFLSDVVRQRRLGLIWFGLVWFGN